MIKWQKRKEFGTGVSRALQRDTWAVDNLCIMLITGEFGEFGSLVRQEPNNSVYLASYLYTLPYA
jgi:hypothetical protein